MKSRKNRALLAGASAIALSMSMATAVHAASGTQFGPPPVVEPPTFTNPATPPVFIGATDTGIAANATATFVTGVTQHGLLTPTITNNGTFAVGATATATGGASRNADAEYQKGLLQVATGTGGTSSAIATLTNNSVMTFEANAFATAITKAVASATIAGDAIQQTAHGGLADETILNNTGSLTIGAFATASTRGPN